MRWIAIIMALGLWVAPAGAALVGRDVSYPQCGQTIHAQGYSIIGVNGGVASKPNPCFALEYDQTRSLELYVNSGNPGSVLVMARHHGTWPRNDSDIDGAAVAVPSQYGTCHTDDSAACAYMYGYQMAERDIADAVAGGVIAPEHERWWIDAETFNSWETDTPAGQARDVADLEGMVAALESAHRELATAVPLTVTNFMGVPLSAIGIYSTDLQWQQITGGQVAQTSDLASLAQWQAGAQTAAEATQACSNTPYAGTSGQVWMTQYTDGHLDGDVNCAP